MFSVWIYLFRYFLTEKNILFKSTVVSFNFNYFKFLKTRPVSRLFGSGSGKMIWIQLDSDPQPWKYLFGFDCCTATKNNLRICWYSVQRLLMEWRGGGGENNTVIWSHFPIERLRCVQFRRNRLTRKASYSVA